MTTMIVGAAIIVGMALALVDCFSSSFDLMKAVSLNASSKSRAFRPG